MMAMEQDEQEPQLPQPNNQTPPLDTEQPATEAKKFPKKLLLIIVASLLVIMSGGLVLSQTVLKQNSRTTSTNNSSAAESLPSNQPQAVEQVFVSRSDGKRTDIKEAEYYAVGVGKTEYYGRVSKINSDYIRMLPTAYKKGDVLTFTGKELHGPEAATYFRVAKITKFQVLTDPAIIDAVKTADANTSDAFPSDNINKYVKNGQFQAYFFTDGSAFFAKTASLDGNFLAGSKHVYVLRTNSSSQHATDISLVLAKPEHYNKRLSKDLAYWQNMKSDSQITKATDYFEKQNP